MSPERQRDISIFGPAGIQQTGIRQTGIRQTWIQQIGIQQTGIRQVLSLHPGGPRCRLLVTRMAGSACPSAIHEDVAELGGVIQNPGARLMTPWVNLFMRTFAGRVRGLLASLHFYQQGFSVPFGAACQITSKLSKFISYKSVPYFAP